MLLGKYLKHFSTTLFLFDALGLGLFTIVGIKLGLAQGFSIGICMALGTITACFGGVVRDVLLNNIPLLFRKEIYALACIMGGGLFFILKFLNLNIELVNIISIVSIFTIRLLAVQFKLSLSGTYGKKV